MDATLIAVVILLILPQILLGHEYLLGTDRGTAGLPAISAMLTETDPVRLRRRHGHCRGGPDAVLGLLPLAPDSRRVALWGLAGYAVLLVGSVLQILGFELHSAQAAPGDVWEARPNASCEPQ